MAKEKRRPSRFVDDEDTADEFSNVIPAEEVSVADLKPEEFEPIEVPDEDEDEDD